MLTRKEKKQLKEGGDSSFGKRERARRTHTHQGGDRV
jgi:hypothetical protein